MKNSAPVVSKLWTINVKIAPEVLGSGEETATITSQFALSIFLTHTQTLAETNPLYQIAKTTIVLEKNQRITPRILKSFHGLRLEKSD